MNEFLQAALDYAKLGWKIFPLAPGSKVPLTSHGVKDATSEKEKIEEWWTRWPTANIAVSCGRGSGIYVIDVDVSDTGDIDGTKTINEFPPLPTTVKQATPRGGFHAFFKSETPPANRNSFRVGIDIRGNGYYVVLAPSIHPNGKKYKWEDRLSPWECPLAEYPDFMRPAVRAPWVQQEVIKTPVLTHNDSDVMRRAGLYLAQCDPAIQGQAGHDKLLYAASRMVYGFLLTDSQAYDILAREYNPRCIPPWDLTDQKDEKDFRRKITEARKLQPNNPEGWLLNEAGYNNVIDNTVTIDCNALLNGNNKTTKVKLTKDSELQFLCHPTGLLGEMCSWINETSLKEQPFLSLAASLTFLGSLFGRKIKDCLGSRTNLYCMGVAPSSAGKQHAINQIRNLCQKAGCIDILGGDYIASDSAIEERMSRSPTTLFLWDEIGHLLAHIKSGASKNHAQVVSLLMKLYSSASSIYLGREYAEKEKQRSIVQPCCCIYGTSTPGRFTSGISPEELQDGWLSRCLIFNSLSSQRKKRSRKNNFNIPSEIIDKVRLWCVFSLDKNKDNVLSEYVDAGFCEQPPKQLEVGTDIDAENVFTAFDDETTEYGKTHNHLACLWGKGEENARRIALIVAAGNSFNNPVITKQVADYSCRLIRFLLLSFEESIAPEISSSRIERDKRKVFLIIKNAGQGGIRIGDLTKATRWLYRKNRQEILDDICNSGEVTTNVVNGHVFYRVI